MFSTIWRRIFSRTSGKVLSLKKLEWITRYKFKDSELIFRALTHRSIIGEQNLPRSKSNEQLEFLGDAILDLIVAEYLFLTYPDKPEGELSKLKSMLVSGNSLQSIAEDMQLGDYIIMSENEARNGGRQRGSILEDAFEAVIAAVYLDGGYHEARKYISYFVLSKIGEMVEQNIDINYKSQLLEYAQSLSMQTPCYEIISESGPDHAKRFEIEVFLSGKPLGRGTGKSKKAAQQNAARESILTLNL